MNKSLTKVKDFKPLEIVDGQVEDGIERIPREYKKFLSVIKADKRKIYIFGADIAGKVTKHILEEDDIFISGFFDNNSNKCNVKINDTPVLEAKELNKTSKESIILIASTYISDIIDQIESLGFYNWVPIADIIKANKHHNFREMLSGSLQTNHAGGEFTKDFIDFAVDNMVNSQQKYLDPNLLFIRSVDLVLTEKCSLKCKDCANLMQYYDNPINIDGDELHQDLEDLCAVADEINEIRIIGGEPLMNKNFHEISLKAASFDNVNKVVIYTNGTICPPEEKIAALKHSKVFVFITTYGSLSRNEKKLSDLLSKHGVQFNNQPAYGWTECGGIKVWDRNFELNKKIFKECCAKHFTTMTDGKLFRCPFSANVERLMAIPAATSDFVSIRGFAKGVGDENRVKKKLRWFLRDKPVLKACDSCNGRTYGDPEITPGIQSKKPIEYEKFSR
jgi:hypothetical protein